MSLSKDEDDDITIPRAAMNKMIKELCPNVRVSNEARELVLNCCTEFIHLLSSEANEACNGQQKKTINAEHVLNALENLGYGEFKKECEDVLSECKDAAAKRRRQSTRLENLGIPEEELLRQQQELFAKARAEQEMISSSSSAMEATSSTMTETPTSKIASASPTSTTRPLDLQIPEDGDKEDDEDYS